MVDERRMVNYGLLLLRMTLGVLLISHGFHK
jgi:putative oxidoreductase